MKPAGFCTHCGFVVESFDGLSGCPQCGATGVPCGYDKQVNVSVNVHELRILGIWAENYARHSATAHEKPADVNVVYAICLRLRKQLAALGHDAPLTMADEFRQLKEAGFDVETNHPSGNDL